MDSREILIYLSLKYEGDWDDIYKHIDNKLPLDDEEAEELLKGVKSNFITILDENYPIELKNIRHPPFVLYYYGDITLLDGIDKNIAVIGSRDCSEYGTKMTNILVKDICARYAIVSGMARGIDTIAAECSINNGGRTIAVLGSGIDYPYPLRNKKLYETIKKNHLVISEYPGECLPKPSTFPCRNRLIAALCRALLVTEAYERSGTLITVDFAYGQKDVLCVPYRGDENSACNELIKQGAYLVQTGQDIIEALEPATKNN